MDVATGAAVVDDDDAVDAVIPPSSTKDEDAYVGESVAFEGTCIGPFADGAPVGYILPNFKEPIK